MSLGAKALTAIATIGALAAGAQAQDENIVRLLSGFGVVGSRGTDRRISG